MSKQLSVILGLDRVRTLWFLYQLERLLRKYGFTEDEIKDTREFALTIRRLEAMA